MFTYDRVTVCKNKNISKMMSGICSKRTAAITVAAAVVLSMAMPVAAMAAPRRLSNRDRHVTNTEVRQALQNTAGVMSASDQTKTTSDADSAMNVATAGATIDVPKKATDGVTLAANGGPSLDISLPNASQAGSAQQVAPGIVGYQSNNGSANAVQATEDGGVRMLTIIDNPNAPTRYDYKVFVPAAGRIEITKDGGAMVMGINSKPIASVATPWAKDANGRQIKTWFTTDGKTLTQHVMHNVPGVVYPVAADPFWFVISTAIFWWAVQRCAAGGIISAVFEYVGGSHSKRAIAAAGAAGCIASFIGGWGILKNMVRIVRL